MVRVPRRWACAALLLFLAQAVAVAGDRARTPHAAVRLVPALAQVAPGARLTVAFEQRLSDGWHTYWQNPGDSGEPVQLTWRLPEGVAAGPIQWPTPDAIPVGPLVNYGYSERAVFLTELAVPGGWPEGEPLAITLDAYWLVCEKECIPEEATLAVTVPTGATNRPDPAARETIAFGRASQPEPLGGRVEYARGGGTLLLSVPGEALGLAAIDAARFFPARWGVVDHAADQRAAVIDGVLTVRAPLGPAPPTGELAGILRTAGEGSDGAPRQGAWQLVATPGGAVPGAGAHPVGTSARAASGPGALLAALAGALLGGVLLNLMPCVFPVLALKAFGLVQHARAGRRARLGGGLAYTAGVLATFLALGAVLLAARAGGSAVGWGFQLQEPAVVAALALVMVAVALNLSGVYSIGHGLTRIDHRAAGRGDWVGSLMTGVLAAVVAAPCTAPFMAAAVGVALTRPALEALGIFLALGLGLALPYLALTASPRLAARLPRPGAWMERLRQLLAFPMYAAAVWLLWVLAQQAGPDRLGIVLLAALLLAFGAWLWELSPGRLSRLGAAAVAALAGWLAVAPPFGATGAPAAAPGLARETAGGGLEAVAYSAEELARLRSAGRTVFLNLTAAWCITCKVNERVALGTATFREALRRHDAVYMRGDWTTRDPAITRLLERHGRAGVPLYVVYGPNGHREVLPQLLTPAIAAGALAAAGPAALARLP